MGKEPCWTGLEADSVCKRGGIGCPLPHFGEENQHWMSERNTLNWNPIETMGTKYPIQKREPVCPMHGFLDKDDVNYNQCRVNIGDHTLYVCNQKAYFVNFKGVIELLLLQLKDNAKIRQIKIDGNLLINRGN